MSKKCSHARCGGNRRLGKEKTLFLYSRPPREPVTKVPFNGKKKSPPPRPQGGGLPKKLDQAQLQGGGVRAKKALKPSQKKTAMYKRSNPYCTRWGADRAPGTGRKLSNTWKESAADYLQMKQKGE